jgi:hypothetical protein
VGLAATPVARAVLRDIASRVAEEWQRVGATVARGEGRFVYEDETASVDVPAAPPGLPCTTVALVGARGLSLRVRVGAAEGDPLGIEEASRASSVAGVVQIGRCEGDPIRRLLVTSDAGRGAFEVVIAHSRSPVPSLRTVLPERTGGVMPPFAEPGLLPPLSPPVHRAEAAEQRARRDLGKIAPRAAWTASSEGSGEGRVRLEAGCHRVEFFAVDPRAAQQSRRARLDLDAELRDEEDDTMLARDRTESPDVHMDLCVGKETAGVVAFTGAPVGSAVLVTHAWWPIPANLPWVFGPEARGKMAKAMLARHVAPPRAPPIALARGVSGTTAVPVELEPGACYLAVAAVTHGHARGLGLRAIVGARAASDERGVNDEAGAIVLCAREQRRARLEVEARGTALSWGLALFRIDSRVWESAR